jgi:hypothetical protein
MMKGFRQRVVRPIALSPQGPPVFSAARREPMLMSHV